MLPITDYNGLGITTQCYAVVNHLNEPIIHLATLALAQQVARDLHTAYGIMFMVQARTN